MSHQAWSWGFYVAAKCRNERNPQTEETNFNLQRKKELRLLESQKGCLKRPILDETECDDVNKNDRTSRLSSG